MVETFLVLWGRGYSLSRMINIENFRGHNFHGWQNYKNDAGVWSIFNILVLTIERKYVNKKNESSIFDSFNEGEY